VAIKELAQGVWTLTIGYATGYNHTLQGRHCSPDRRLDSSTQIRKSNILNTFYQYCPLIPSYSKFPVAIDVIGGRIEGEGAPCF